MDFCNEKLVDECVSSSTTTAANNWTTLEEICRWHLFSMCVCVQHTVHAHNIPMTSIHNCLQMIRICQLGLPWTIGIRKFRRLKTTMRTSTTMTSTRMVAAAAAIKTIQMCSFFTLGNSLVVISHAKPKIGSSPKTTHYILSSIQWTTVQHVLCVRCVCAPANK